MHPPSTSLLRVLRSIALPYSHPRTRVVSRQVSCSKLCRALTSSTLYRAPNQSQTHLARNRTINPHAPTHRDRGPASTEDTQTDFGKMDILGNMGTPATSIDACVADGFHLNNGVKTVGGTGVLLLGGEAFAWAPWRGENPDARIGGLLDKKGLLHVPKSGLAVLELLYPKPDLLIVGTGSRLWMLAKETREYLSTLGIRVDIMDTQNAAAAYNLLATERGVEGVGAAFLPLGWKGTA